MVYPTAPQSARKRSRNSRLVTISAARAWELAAVANHPARAKGAYRASAGGINVYVTFGEVSLRTGGG
ncbi:MAG: hypothetical protein ACU85U_04670 [Gammaproteobacteria bacterium]